jgi:hypothetical protein
MWIVLLPSPEANVIAREDQLGSLEGAFVVEPDGRVFYRHPWDERSYLAGPDTALFREAAAAWNRYADEAEGQKELEQFAAVARLRAELMRLGVLEAGPASVWLFLLEQAEAGLL